MERSLGEKSPRRLTVTSPHSPTLGVSLCMVFIAIILNGELSPAYANVNAQADEGNWCETETLSCQHHSLTDTTMFSSSLYDKYTIPEVENFCMELKNLGVYVNGTETGSFNDSDAITSFIIPNKSLERSTKLCEVASQVYPLCFWCAKENSNGLISNRPYKGYEFCSFAESFCIDSSANSALTVEEEAVVINIDAQKVCKELGDRWFFKEGTPYTTALCYQAELVSPKACPYFCDFAQEHFVNGDRQKWSSYFEEFDDDTFYELHSTGYLGANTTAQKRALIWMSRISAILAFCGASYILYQITTSGKKRKTTYYQMLSCMACFDICTALGWVFATAPIPPNTLWKEVEGSIGNEATCKAQAFFVQLGFTSVFYNVSLASYYLLVIRKGWGERQLQAPLCKILMHGIPLTLGFVLAFGALPFYKGMEYGCHIAPSPISPMWVILVFVVIPIASSIVAISASMLLVYAHVRQQAAKQRQWTSNLSMHGSANDLETSNRGLRRGISRVARKTGTDSLQTQVFWQCFWYVLAFYVTWPIILATYMFSIDTERRGGLPVSMTVAFVAPLQGFSNFLVFIRPLLVNRCKSKAKKNQKRGATHKSDHAPGTTRSSNCANSLLYKLRHTLGLDGPSSASKSSQKIQSQHASSSLSPAENGVTNFDSSSGEQSPREGNAENPRPAIEVVTGTPITFECTNDEDWKANSAGNLGNCVKDQDAKPLPTTDIRSSVGLNEPPRARRSSILDRLRSPTIANEDSFLDPSAALALRNDADQVASTDRLDRIKDPDEPPQARRSSILDRFRSSTITREDSFMDPSAALALRNDDNQVDSTDRLNDRVEDSKEPPQARRSSILDRFRSSTITREDSFLDTSAILALHNDDNQVDSTDRLKDRVEDPDEPPRVRRRSSILGRLKSSAITKEDSFMDPSAALALRNDANQVALTDRLDCIEDPDEPPQARRSSILDRFRSSTITREDSFMDPSAALALRNDDDKVDSTDRLDRIEDPDANHLSTIDIGCASGLNEPPRARRRNSILGRLRSSIILTKEDLSATLALGIDDD